MAQPRRIGVFGGTFDPPHLGHLILAAEASYQLDLNLLLFVLTPIPPHKLDNHITPLADRLAMLEAAIHSNPGFALSTVEIDRPGPHYAVDTMRQLRKMYPADALIYLMGGDSLSDLPLNWHTPAEFVAQCDQIGVMRRPLDKLDLERVERLLPGTRAKVHLIEAPLLDIASSEIRQRVREGRPFCYYLLEPVRRVIETRGIYGAQNTC